MKLSPLAERFVLHWGEMGSRWGVNRTVSQLHALLFLAGRPMDAEEMAQTLGVARSNISTSLKELQSWKLVRVCHVMGDRRDYFETSTDVWELFKIVVEGRKQREVDPTLSLLRDCVLSPELEAEPQEVQQRIQDSLEFVETLTTCTEEMLRLSPDQLMRTLGISAKVSRTLRGK